MRQFHARANFRRVALMDQRRAGIIASYQARWTGDARPAMETERYRRLCRISALYRVAGYLNAQEI